MKLLTLILLITVACTFNPNMSSAQLDAFLKSGSFRGYFSPGQFWSFVRSMKSVGAYSNLITERESLGMTDKGNHVYGFYVCSDASRINELKTTKNILYMTGLHHSREPLTVTMIVLMVINMLKGFTVPGHNHIKALLRDNVIFFVPLVNIDSYTYMNKMDRLGRATEQVMMIRKNRNVNPQCGALRGGVDLNRNYDFKFGMDESGSSSNPCAEDYRGPAPFSEKETLAIKTYVDAHPNIVSCVNIHTYGNDWIYPFNYVNDHGDKYLKTTKPLFFDFFKEFEHECKTKNRKSHFGNSASLLDYPTNGEAGDWFTGAKNILNLDVELGNPDKKSDTFYPPRHLLPKIVRFNYIIMNDFLRKHIVDFDLSHIMMSYGHVPTVIFEIVNKSISSLKNAELHFRPVFANDEQVDSKISYVHKELPSMKGPKRSVKNDVVHETFKGRYTMEIDVTFDNEAAMNKLIGLEMKIKRKEDSYFGYPDQRFMFKLKPHPQNK